VKCQNVISVGHAWKQQPAVFFSDDSNTGRDQLVLISCSSPWTEDLLDLSRSASKTYLAGGKDKTVYRAVPELTVLTLLCH